MRYMDEYNTLFNEYMKNFKESSTLVKRKEIFDSVKDLFKTFEVLCVKDNIKLNFLKNEKFLDDIVNFKNEDDYLEELALCIENTKNIIGVYLESQDKNSH